MKVSRNKAIEQISALLDEASHAKSVEKGALIVKKARQIQLRNRIHLPRELKKRFCKKCFSLWMPGKTVRIRTRPGKLVFACLVCKNVQRMQL